MHLTHDRTRRTAGTVSLLAALLLVLNALFVTAAATAQQPENPGNGNSPATECGVDVAFVKIGDQSEASAGFSVADYDFGNGTVGDVVTVLDTTGDSDVAVIEVTIIAVKDGVGDPPTGEVIEVQVSLLEAAGFTIEEVVVKTGASDDVDGDTATLEPGDSITLTTGVGGGNGLSHLTLCLGQLPGDEPVTPAAPDFVEPSCANENTASVVINPTPGVLYTVTGDEVPGGTVTVTATAQDGYVLEGTDEWQHTFDAAEEPCGDQPTEVTPEAPTFSDPTCDVPVYGLVVPTDTDAVTYEVDGEPGAGALVTVTAVAADGYVFPDGAQTVWEHTYGQEPTGCEPPTETVAPAASTSIRCDTPFVTLDNTGSDVSVVFQVSGAVEGGILEVPVAAGETETVDVVLAEDSAYEVTVSADGMEDVTAAGTYDCEQTQVQRDTVVRPQVSFVDPTCEDLDAAEVVATPVDGITYGLVGEVAPGGTVTVTASAEDGYVIPAGQRTEWTHTFADPDDCVEVAPQVLEKPQPAPVTEVQSEQLAATGLDSMELLLLALLLMGLGGMALLAPAPRRVR